jgi:hypothetical protein
MSGGAPTVRSQQFILAAPGLAAAAVGAYRQVGDQADAHAAATGGLLCALQAAGDQPLAEGIKPISARLASANSTSAGLRGSARLRASGASRVQAFGSRKACTASKRQWFSRASPPA